jgi:DNA-binding NarL/FixJ family response regulator
MTLTPREKQVIDLLLEACGPTEMAKQLGITLNTVKHHMDSIYKKYGLYEFKGHKRIKLAVMVYWERQREDHTRAIHSDVYVMGTGSDRVH